MMTKEVVFPSKKKYNIDYSDEIVDLITQLLKKERYERLQDAEEIIAHPFFKGLDSEIEAVMLKQAKPPLVPKNIHRADVYNADESIDINKELSVDADD